MRILFNGILCFYVRPVIPAHLTHNFLFILSKRNMDSTSKQTDNTAQQQPKHISVFGYFLYSHCINFNYGIDENCLLILVHILCFSLAVLSKVLLCCSTLLHLLLQIQQVLLHGSHCTRHLKMLWSCCFIPRRAFSKCFRGLCCSWHNSCKVSRLSSMSVL